MLKSMLTARQLGIEEWERDALIRVRDDLESGKIPASRFDMVEVGVDIHDCGTAGCIGGWMAVYANKARFWRAYCGTTHPLGPLFFPGRRGGWDAGYDATPSQAIRAINNFLYTGKPDWAEAMSHA